MRSPRKIMEQRFENRTVSTEVLENKSVDFKSRHRTAKQVILLPVHGKLYAPDG